MRHVGEMHSLPSGKEVVNAAFKDRRIIITTFIVTNVVFGLVAVMIPASYEASASLLVLPSTQWSAPAPPGTAASNQAALTDVEVLPTEVQILSGDGLHADVIRKVGLANLYPSLANPSLLHRLKSSIESGIINVISMIPGVGPLAQPPVDPVLEAVPAFDKKLLLAADPVASAITVSFRAWNPNVAASTVNTLVDLYLKKRADLYASNQSDTVLPQIQATQQHLTDIANTAADFRVKSGIYNFDTQQGLLLNQRDSLEKDLLDAENSVSQLEARTAELDRQEQTTPSTVVQSTATDYDTQMAGLEAAENSLLAQEANLRTQFQADSLPVQSVVSQIAMVDAQMQKERQAGNVSSEQTGRNANYDLILQSQLQGQADLKAALAREDSDRGQLEETNTQLETLDKNKAAYDDLARQQVVAEQGYANLVQQYYEIREGEALAQSKLSNVRLIEPAIPPLKPSPIALIVLILGFMLSIFFGGLAALLSEFQRPGVISAEKLQRLLGVVVLATVSDKEDLDRSPAMGV